MAFPEFTFVWRIGSFQYYWRKDAIAEIVSSEFAINNTVETKWRLRISDRYHSNNKLIKIEHKYVKFFLRRTDNNELDSVEYWIQISLMKCDKSLYHYPGRWETFYKNEQYIKVSSGEAPFSELKEFFWEDILTVRCKMHPFESNSIEEQCFAHTCLAVERMFCVAVVEEFSDLIPGLKRTIRIKSASVENKIFCMNVCLSDEGKLVINIPIKTDYFITCFFKVFILDNSWNWHNGGQDSEWREVGEACNFPLILDFQTLMNKQKYLRNNVLTLKFEIAYTGEAEPQKIETVKYGLDDPETLQQITPCLKNLPAPEMETSPLKSATTVTEDLVSLYRDRTFCDMKLRTETETFQAHKAILSARSPVFKKMFTTDMREKTNDCVDILDLNADTVRKLLEFMYSDTVDAMDWQTAVDLYFAGDKYEIASLKLKCSNFLKLNILPTNCCELLLLSDMHNDSDLKTFVQDYIATRDQDIFGSEEWRVFLGNHMELAAETMRWKYARK